MHSWFEIRQLGLVHLGLPQRAQLRLGSGAALPECAGGELAITYLNDKAKPFVEPLAREINGDIFLPCDVTKPSELESLFEAIKAKWGRLDFLFHSIV
jgi:enoyl-[acyl-carrier-protein] reductase (NADH)